MEQHRSPTRRLRIFLRDFRMVEAAVQLADGQSLASFFAHRKGYLNLYEAFWPGTNERIEHAALKLDQVLWAASASDAVPLTVAAGHSPGRSIEVQLDGGLLLRAHLSTGNQRLSDHLEAAGRFVTLTDAQLLRSGRPPKRVNVQLGDIVLNQEAIQAAWETVVPRVEATTEPAAESDEAEAPLVLSEVVAEDATLPDAASDEHRADDARSAVSDVAPGREWNSPASDEDVSPSQVERTDEAPARRSDPPRW